MREDNPWLKYANEDIKTLNIIGDSDVFRTICFHSQQLAEKIIKAALLEKEVKVPRTHNITYLLSIFDFNIPIEKSDMEFLSNIYIESRYPPDIGLLPWGEPNKDDAERAVRIAKEIYEHFIKNY